MGVNKTKKPNAQSSREAPMLVRKATRLLGGLFAAIAVLGMAVSAEAQENQAKKIKIGVIYDLTGPLAGGGSELQYIGAKIMLDHFSKTGVEGYKVEAVYADAQSKPDVAINEAVRLVEQEKVDMLLGFYSSAQCVPVAARVEQLKKFMWITTCISSAVFENKNYKYIFRPQASGDQFGLMTMDFIAANSKSKFGKDPKDLRVAIIHEDGAYGVDVAKGNVAGAKKAGFNVVLKEGYSATAPDLSALVTKLKRARPDVIFHTGYNPDITLLLRQARENGLRFKMLFGAGAGYSQLDKLRATFGADIDNFCNIDPVPAQLLDPSKLAPGIGDLTKTMVARYQAKTGATDVPPHCSMGFNQTWLLLNNVLPVAKEKYGGFDPDSIRKAALDVDIPPGGTIQGYGVKFYPPGTPLAGQNERSTPVVMQNAGEHISVVWPTNIRTQDPVFPLPKSSIYAA
jgi:branched-chain amino acid transport system substrate-binding protein